MKAQVTTAAEAAARKRVHYRIGIDIGRVIIGPTVEGVEDTRFIGTSLEDAIETPPAPSAFDVICDLTRQTSGNVWLLSTAGPSVQKKTHEWFGYHGFYDATGLRKNRLYFVREWSEKAEVARELKLDVFIDDRLDALESMAGIVERRILFGETPKGGKVACDEEGKPTRLPAGIVWAKTWEAVRALLLDDEDDDS
jgi:hypothetical protein